MLNNRAGTDNISYSVSLLVLSIVKLVKFCQSEDLFAITGLFCEDQFLVWVAFIHCVNVCSSIIIKIFELSLWFLPLPFCLFSLSINVRLSGLILYLNYFLSFFFHLFVFLFFKIFSTFSFLKKTFIYAIFLFLLIFLCILYSFFIAF